MSGRRLLILLLVTASVAPAQARRGGRLSWDGLAGRQRLLQQRWEAAAAAFQRAVDRGHAAPAEWEGLGYALLKAGRFSRAAGVYGRLCGEYPRKASFWVNLGLAYANQEPADMNAAEKAFRHALEVKPRDPNALLNLAVLLHRLGRATEAREFYQCAEAAAPRRGYVLTGLADILRDQGNFAGAYWEYQRALTRQPGWVPTHLGLARLFFGRGAPDDDAEAINHAREFLRCTQNDADRWARYRGEAEELIRRAGVRRRQHAARQQPDREPPEISLLWPDPTLTQGRDDFTCRVDHRQLTVVGVVSDDRAVSQVTVNGVYPDWFPVTGQELEELKNQIREKGLILGKGLIRGKELFREGDLLRRPGPQKASYVFTASVPLPQPMTLVRIAALDFGGHTTTVEFRVQRRLLPVERGGTPRPQPEGTIWGVFIGVDHYTAMYPDPAQRSPTGAATVLAPSLRYAASDAQRLYDLLCDPERGCITPNHAFLLHDLRVEETEKPTRAHIRDCLSRLREQVGPDDTVLLFFSGHGAVDREGNHYLLTRDSVPDPEGWPRTALDRQSLVELSELRAQRVVLFLDACRAGGMLGDEGAARALAGEPYDRFLQVMGRSCRLLFAACGKDEVSYEDTLELRAGVFGHFLAEGLAGQADANADGVVDLGELLTYVEDQVCGWSEKHLSPEEQPQRPVRLPPNERIDLPLAFTPVAAARKALARVEPLLTAAELAQARAALETSAEQASEAEWLIELTAPSAPELPLTVAQYREYRRVLSESPDSRAAQLYRRLPPRQAVLAIAHGPTSERANSRPADQQWGEVTERLLRGEMTAGEYANWIEGWAALPRN